MFKPLALKPLILWWPKIMPCWEALPEKTNLSLSQDDFLGSFKTVECKGSWKTVIHFNNALLHGFHRASYHRTELYKRVFNIQLAKTLQQRPKPPRGWKVTKAGIATAVETEMLGKHQFKNCCLTLGTIWTDDNIWPQKSPRGERKHCKTHALWGEDSPLTPHVIQRLHCCQPHKKTKSRLNQDLNKAKYYSSTLLKTHHFRGYLLNCAPKWKMKQTKD